MNSPLVARSILLDFQKKSNLHEFVQNHRVAELTSSGCDLPPLCLYFPKHLSCLLFQFFLFPFSHIEITLELLLLFGTAKLIWIFFFFFPSKWQRAAWRQSKDDITLSDSLHVVTEMVLASLVHTIPIFMKPSISVILGSVWCYHYMIKWYLLHIG